MAMGGARLVAAGILLSRIFGLVRQKVTAYFLGDGDAADVLASAFRIPNLLQNLFGEAVLSASFIPVYAKLIADGDEQEAGRVAGAIASLLALVTTVVVLLGVLAAPWLVAGIAPGFAGEKRELTVLLVRVLFPGVGLLVMSAWCLGVLNSHKRFFLSYASPVLWNIAMIAAFVIAGPRQAMETLIVTVAWASVVGSLLQFVIQLPLVFRLDRAIRLSLDRSSSVRTVVKNFFPAFMGRGVVQISAFVDTAIASLIGAGALATLNYAQVISMLPVSLFGISVSAAELPSMSGEQGSDAERAEAVRARLDRGLARIAYFVVPSASAFLLIGGVLAAGLYEGGAFTRESAQWVWAALAGSAIGLLASTMGRLYASASYALLDTVTPLRYAVVRVLLGASLGLGGALFLPEMLGVDARWGIAALTAASGLAGWVEFLLLRRALTRRIGRTGVPARRMAALWFCAILAGLAGSGAVELVRDRHAVLLAFVAVATFGVTYLGLTRLLKVDDARRA